MQQKNKQKNDSVTQKIKSYFRSNFTLKSALGIFVWNALVICISISWYYVDNKGLTLTNIITSLFVVSVVLNLFVIIALRSGAYSNFIRPFFNYQSKTKNAYKQRTIERGKRTSHKPYDNLQLEEHFRTKPILVFLLNIALASVIICVCLIIYYA